MNTARAERSSIRALLRAAGDALGERLEAELLLAHTLGENRTCLHAWPERICADDDVERFRRLVRRRLGGEPIAHLVGHREFWSLNLRVTPDTLIPRPETEALVELALREIPQDATWRVTDLGTGGGAIALALARERPRCHIVATDRSPAALAIARENAARHAIGNLEFRLGDWWQALPGQRFQIAVSNPPYIADTDPHLERGDLPWEPRSALAAGVDGLDPIRQIIAGASNHLLPGGLLMLEHGYDQGDAARALLQEAGMLDVAIHRDLSAHDRVTWCRCPD